MKYETDSMIIFKNREQKWLEKEVLGQEKNALENIL